MLINEIYLYLWHNLEDSDESWEWTHTPYLKKLITGLCKQEAEEFGIRLYEWDDKLLFKLADPIILSKNAFLDNEFLYSKIFGKINDTEKLENLAENLVRNKSNFNKWDLQLLIDIKSNLIRVITIVQNQDWIQKHRETIFLLDEEINSRNR